MSFSTTNHIWSVKVISSDSYKLDLIVRKKWGKNYEFKLFFTNKLIDIKKSISNNFKINIKIG